jgi:hypothetical protein
MATMDGMRRRRWWTWLALALMAGLVGSGWVVRAHAATMSGRIAAMFDDSAPRPGVAVVSALPADLGGWAAWCRNSGCDCPVTTAAEDDWLAGAPGPPSADLVQNAAANAAALARLRVILAQGHHPMLPARITAASRLADLPGWDPGDVTGDESFDAAARCLRVVARLADDPRPALADVDGVVAASVPANGLHAFWTYNRACDRRDTLHLALAIAGNLPADARARWAAEPDRLDNLRNGLDGARRFWIPLYAVRPVSHGLWSYVSYDEGTPAEWWGLADRAEAQRRDFGEAEDLLAGKAPARSWAAGSTWSVDRILSGALNGNARHRMALLAAQVIDAYRRTGAVPADGAGLDLTGGRNRLPLTYAVVNPHRFVLAVAAAGVPPYYHDAGTWHAPESGVRWMDFDATRLVLDLAPVPPKKGVVSSQDGVRMTWW